MSTDSRTVSTHTADYIPAAVCFTVITAPQTITKTYAKDAAGQLVKKAAAAVGRSIAERVTVYSATDLAQCINRLSTKQAIMHGVHDAKRVTVYSQKRYNALDDKRGAVTRTKAMTAWPASGGVLVIDYDPPAGGDGWTLEQLKTEIRHILPLDAVAHVTGYSSSSFIYDGDLQLQAQRGLRIYILVTDASDIPRAGQVIFDRLWLGGHGYYALSKSGGMLNRSAIDSSVWQPSRLDFASGAQCSAPINQRRPAMTASNGDLLDTRRLLPDLSDAERSRLDTLQAAARQAITPQAERIRGVYIKDRAKQQAKRETPQGANPERLAVIEKQIERSLDSTILHADWLVMLDDGTVVSIAEIYANRAKYHCATAKDPIEHDYNDYHTCAIIYTDNYDIKIVSQAHGQRTYIGGHLVTCAAVATDTQAWAALAAYNAVLSEFKSEKAKTRGAIDDRLTTAQLQGGALFALLLDRAHQVPIVHPTIDAALCVNKLKHGCDDATAAYLAALVRRRYDKDYSRLAKGLTLSDDQKKTIHTLDYAAYTLPTGITALRAAMGSGKTAFVGREWRRFADDHDLQFLAITHRAALCTELATVLKCTNYSTINRTQASEKDYKNLAVCINSIDRPDIRENVKAPDVVVIDEISQLRRAWGAVYHNDTGTANGSNPAATYKRFCDIVKQAAHVLVLDAALSDDDLQWLRGIRDEITVLEHVKKSGDGLKVKFKYAFNVGAKTAIFAEIAYLLSQGQKVWVSVAEKGHGRALLEYLKQNGLSDVKALFIHRQTPTKQKNEILADVDAASKGVQLFIASPTISSGISVTHADGAHFDAVYVIGNGSGAGVDDIVQMLRRVRYVTDLTVCVWRQPRPVQIDDDALLLDAGRTDAQPDALYTLAQKVQARRNFERRNFLFAVATGLQLAGFAVECTKTNGDCAALGRLSAAITADDAQRFNNARRLSVFDYDEIQAKTSKTAADYDAIDAFELRDQMNIHDREITTDDIKLWQGGYGREDLARIAALHGEALGNRENARLLVRLYRVIFNGIELSDFIDGDKVTLTHTIAGQIADNAWACGREGVAHGLLPDSYRGRKKASERPMRTAQRILELSGILSVNPTFISNKVGLTDNLGNKVGLTDSKRQSVHIYTEPKLPSRIGAALGLVGARHDATHEKDRVTQRSVHERHFPIVSTNDTFLSGGVSTNDTFYNKTSPATAQPIEVRLKNCPPFTIYPPS